jgi:hypothetical protein
VQHIVHLSRVTPPKNHFYLPDTPSVGAPLARSNRQRPINRSLPRVLAHLQPYALSQIEIHPLTQVDSTQAGQRPTASK